ncbi:MAG: PriCT-2 domain-containing protein, partial [Paludibacteraceae bacterium]|nr:PriCT-2 domain-containing protein [Paludibacteraceae bacterium]
FEQSEKSKFREFRAFCEKKENSVRNKNSVREEKNDVIVKNHRVLYERIRGYLFERYGIETDHTSDIARPCYLCHDVDAYYDEPNFKDNPASRFLKITDNRLQITDNRVQSTNKNNNDYENDIEKIVREIEHRRIDITNDYHDWMLVAMALAGTCGATGEHYFHRISQFHPKYDNAEAHRMYQSCVRNTHGAVGIGTIVYLIHNA